MRRGTVGWAKAPGALPGRTGASIQRSSKKRSAIVAISGANLPIGVEHRGARLGPGDAARSAPWEAARSGPNG